jgi:hypothetical protein
MGRIVGFRGGDHREMAELLPWHVTGALGAEESARVEAHLSVCAECRAELAFQQQLRMAVADTSLDVERGWSRMRRQIEQDEARRFKLPAWSPTGWFGRGPGVGSGATALARTSAAWGGWATASVLLVAGVVMVSSPRYHALSAKAAPTRGNMVVVFRPETPEANLRAALAASHARVVDGPTEAGGYVLATPAAERPQALALLRSRTDVALAQPIDPDPSP